MMAKSMPFAKLALGNQAINTTYVAYFVTGTVNRTIQHPTLQSWVYAKQRSLVVDSAVASHSPIVNAIHILVG